jgi:hypothetical protein
LKKTKPGYKALSVANELEYDVTGHFYNRKQSYDDFIERMFEIYNSENMFMDKLRKNENINVSIKETILDTSIPFRYRLNRLINNKRAKGFKHLAFDDYNTHELLESSSFVDLIEEVEYDLRPGNFFPPHQIASTLSSLAQLRYKNTHLVPKVREKMLAILQNKDQKAEEEFDINKVIYGDKRGRTNRYHVYKGFQNSKEFYTHVETLLDWKSDEQDFIKAEKETQGVQGDEGKEYQEILVLMKDIVAASKEMKSIQAELAEAIESVRSQYSLMSKNYDQQDFLQKNKYIKYDLLELQEKLVEGGMITPDEATGREAYEKMSFSDKMNRAKEVFYELTNDYYPEMAPLTHHFDAINEPLKRENISITEKEDNNQLNLKYIGLILGKLSEMRNSIMRDNVPINEYFEQKVYGNEMRNDLGATAKDPNVEHINKYYTQFWGEVTETYNAMFPAIHQMLSSKEHIPLNHLMLLSYGLNQGEVVDSELPQMLEGKIKQALKHPVPNFTTNDIIYGAYGLANSLVSYRTINKTFKALESQINKVHIDDLNLNQKLRLTWALTVMEAFDNNLLKELVQDLNYMPFENAQNELQIEEFDMLRDIYYGLEHLNHKADYKIKNQFIKVLATNSSTVKKDYPEKQPKIDPFRSKLLDALSKSLHLITYRFVPHKTRICFR